ncbi:rhodanese-like domain-containing protein [Acidisphaera sp. L21]|uniref:rhodanese-like domain-containing protein n=1 Tax=Acidisphaera sp. L21 TaxID=1641851 RepID=UPI00131C0C56|nr:rhodanese-like domain-containing protein [Acidisphaera sp. L21]
MVDNVAPKQVWEALVSDAHAKLVDVRTDMEWAQIGVPDLDGAGKTPTLISWQVAPTMQVNAGFVDDLKSAGLTPEDHIYFLCRSGVRSLAAAHAAQAAGFPHVYNIADGFEGPPNGQGIRGEVAGWQADELPWKQN